MEGVIGINLKKDSGIYNREETRQPYYAVLVLFWAALPLLEQFCLSHTCFFIFLSLSLTVLELKFYSNSILWVSKPTLDCQRIISGQIIIVDNKQCIGNKLNQKPCHKNKSVIVMDFKLIINILAKLLLKL